MPVIFFSGNVALGYEFPITKTIFEIAIILTLLQRLRLMRWLCAR
jgi:hypothetical protein